MKKIRFFLQYRANPVWVVEEDGGSCDGLPDDLKGDKELEELLDEISQEYDSLFEDTSMVFEFHGFPDKVSRQKFADKVYRAIDLLTTKTDGLYEFEVILSEDDF